MIAALCLATDLGMGFPFEHGLHSTLIATRLAERLGVDSATASQTYYACLLSHAGCTTDAHVTAELFGDSLTTQLHPVIRGSGREVLLGLIRALPQPDRPAPVRASRSRAGCRSWPARASAHHSELRGCGDAGGRGRPAPVGGGPARLYHGALGRPRTTPPREGGGDPGGDADRARGRGLRLAASSGGNGASGAPRPRARGACVRPRGCGLWRTRTEYSRSTNRVGLGRDPRPRARPTARAPASSSIARSPDGQLAT